MSESLRPGGRGRDSRVVTSSMRSEGDIEMTSAQLQWQKQFMFRISAANRSIGSTTGDRLYNHGEGPY